MRFEQCHFHTDVLRHKNRHVESTQCQRCSNVFVVLIWGNKCCILNIPESCVNLLHMKWPCIVQPLCNGIRYYMTNNLVQNDIFWNRHVNYFHHFTILWQRSQLHRASYSEYATPLPYSHMCPLLLTCISLLERCSILPLQIYNFRSFSTAPGARGQEELPPAAGPSDPIPTSEAEDPRGNHAVHPSATFMYQQGLRGCQLLAPRNLPASSQILPL